MKKLTLAALIIGTALGTGVCATMPAQARDSFVFSLDTGNVAFAYSDGYYDHNRRWHKWRDHREAREFRARYSDRYNERGRRHYPNQGWRDEDHDGVPNRFDDHPNNPHRD